MCDSRLRGIHTQEDSTKPNLRGESIAVAGSVIAVGILVRLLLLPTIRDAPVAASIRMDKSNESKVQTNESELKSNKDIKTVPLLLSTVRQSWGQRHSIHEHTRSGTIPLRS